MIAALVLLVVGVVVLTRARTNEGQTIGAVLLLTAPLWLIVSEVINQLS